MKKYILRLIDFEIFRYELSIKEAEARIESGNWDNHANQIMIIGFKKKIAIAEKQRKLFLKKMK